MDTYNLMIASFSSTIKSNIMTLEIGFLMNTLKTNM